MKKKKNMNSMAKKITKLEGLKVEISIAQVKEVLKQTANLLASDSEYLIIWGKYVSKKFKKSKK